MKHEQTWIQMLFQRGHGLDAFRNRFTLDFHRQLVQEQIAEAPDRMAQLRAAALDALNSGESDITIQGLAFLLVAGTSEDLPAAASFTASIDERIQKAAKTCHFELMKDSEKG